APRMARQGFPDRPRLFQPRRSNCGVGRPPPRPAPGRLPQRGHRAVHARDRWAVRERLHPGGQDRQAAGGAEEVREPTTPNQGGSAMPAAKPVAVGNVKCGPGQPLMWIAGPCVIESLDMTLFIAEALKRLADRLELPLV